MSFSLLRSYISLLRPVQWLKNLMIFFPPFLSGDLLETCLNPRSVTAFSAFCLASSATYIFNDILDRTNDSHHPHKSTRPLPSGRIPVVSAFFLACFLLCCAALAGWMVSGMFVLYLASYLAITLAYSLKLKEYPLLDIFCISAGFLLRLEAGGAAFGIPISEWLFRSVFLLSIFLSTGKRLSEKNRLGTAAVHHRKVLDAYPDGYLEGVMYMTGGAVLVTYTMYVISRHSGFLTYSVPVCCFGLLRYILRVTSGKGGDPTDSLTKDLPLLATSLLWTVLVGWGIYAP
jgi:4-hydroxybenzoate polyprenyltransferase